MNRALGIVTSSIVAPAARTASTDWSNARRTSKSRRSQKYARGSLGLALVDFERSGYMATWDPEQSEALHTSGARSNRTVVRTSPVSFSLRVLNVAECHFQPV